MHRVHAGLLNHNSSANEGSYGSIISQSVIFFTPNIYLGVEFAAFYQKYRYCKTSLTL